MPTEMTFPVCRGNFPFKFSAKMTSSPNAATAHAQNGRQIRNCACANKASLSDPVAHAQRDITPAIVTQEAPKAGQEEHPIPSAAK